MPRSPLGKGTASTRRGNLDIATNHHINSSSRSTADLYIKGGLHVVTKRRQAYTNTGALPRRDANSYTLTMVELSIALVLSVHRRLVGPIIAASPLLVDVTHHTAADVTHHTSPLRKMVMCVQNPQQPASLSVRHWQPGPIP